MSPDREVHLYWVSQNNEALKERMAKILLIEDDEVAAEFVGSWLLDENYMLEHANRGDLGLEWALQSDFDLILLDWELPGMSGVEILKELRHQNKTMPIIMLTGKDALADKTTGLDGGADDYITKPFELQELSSRIKVQLRRSAKQATNLLQIRGIELDSQQFKATACDADGKNLVIDLLPKEFALLEFFMRNADRVFNAEAIMRRVWSTDSESSTAAFRTALMRLRKKLVAPAGQSEIIETVHGLGYRFNSKA